MKRLWLLDKEYVALFKWVVGDGLRLKLAAGELIVSVG